MDAEARVITNNAVLTEVAEKLRLDKAFKAQLSQDPRKAVESLGIAVPDDVTLRLEQDQDSLATEHLVVYGGVGGEFTDEDLEQVAGGFSLSAGNLLSHDVAGMRTFSSSLRLPVLRTIELYGSFGMR